MKIEQVKLTQVKTNAENPRTITKPKFQKLIDSLLVLPAMLEIRPVVVDSRMVALGGNMRLNALKEIAKMPVKEIADRLFRSPEYQEKSQAERERLVDFWGKWLEKPMVYIINAKHLTESERKQFLIKDNVSYGQWDYDKLANKWDENRLEGWGLDVWTQKPTEFAPLAGGAGTANVENEDSDGAELDESKLPDELQGVDMTPDKLENIKGDDATPSEHIVITYSPEEREELAEWLGVDPEVLFSKICWRIDELEKLMGVDAVDSIINDLNGVEDEDE